MKHLLQLVSSGAVFGTALIFFFAASATAQTAGQAGLQLADDDELADFAFAFESIDDFEMNLNTSSDPGLVLSLSDDAAEGATSLMFDYDFIADEDWGGSVGFRYESPTGMFADMSGFDGISLYYKVLDPINDATYVNFDIKLGDFSTGEALELWQYRTKAVIADDTGEWQRLEVLFDSFVLPDWAAQGDGELNPDSIVRWEMQVVVDPPGAGVTYTGTVLLDNLGLFTAPPVSNEPSAVPGGLALSQNYPNPFRSSTTIGYEVGASAHVTLAVYNALGQRVATLVDGAQTAGSHDVRFDGEGLASGVYFYRLTVGDRTSTRQMLLVK